MLQITQIKKQQRPVEFDYRALYAIGLDAVRSRARGRWTDYNTHDPGITALELCSYVFTELSYRAALPIEDLLASASDNAAHMQQQFFTARKILPNRALTLLDYRKLLIDLPGVKNAWLRPEPLSYYADTLHGRLLTQDSGQPGVVPVDIAGLYRVTLEYMDDVTTQARRDEIDNSVVTRLQANRNLCEDFVAVEAVAEQSFILCCELELTPGADTAQVKAQILFAVQQYLAPDVPNYSLDDMLARTHADGTPYGVEEIFDGPALDCGFIDDTELAAADLREQIRLSDVIATIMDVPGVVAVRDIVLNPATETAPLADKWLVPVAARHKAVLDRQLSRLVLYKRNMPVVADAAQSAAAYTALAAAAAKKLETPHAYDLPIPLGRFRDPQQYYSLQNDFPALYGLSETGLSGAADDSRRALAYQLKAYLLFFDQLLADCCAQLAHIADLFSSDPAQLRTYFYQVVDSFADSEKIYKVADIVAAIEAHIEDSADIVARRNRFLDHLIARFAEQFSDLAQVLYSAFQINPDTLAAYKARFLGDYPALSADRGLAYNHTLQDDADLWNSANVSGLERRLCALLGIRNATRRNLGEISYDIYAEIDSDPTDEFRFRVRDRVSGKILLSSSTHYTTRDEARTAMQRAIAFAQLASGYQLLTTSNGRFYFNIVDDHNEVVARRIEYFDTAALRQQAIDYLIDYLQVHYSDEGMYVIENLLLRPGEQGGDGQGTDPFLPICVDPGCSDCADNDPYSYRLHIMLPAYGPRFSNMDFRRYAEALIRAEVPAHILPKICWISAADMATLEQCYRDWIYLESGRDSADREQKIQKLIDILYAAKNVYPQSLLHECDSAAADTKFIVGRTSLGSMPTSDT